MEELDELQIDLRKSLMKICDSLVQTDVPKGDENYLTREDVRKMQEYICDEENPVKLTQLAKLLNWEQPLCRKKGGFLCLYCSDKTQYIGDNNNNVPTQLYSHLLGFHEKELTMSYCIGVSGKFNREYTIE